jgi:hypothetical protein
MDMQKCSKCGKMVEGWTLWFGACEDCASKTKAVAKKEPDRAPTMWGHNAAEVIDGLMSDRKELEPATKKREPLECGYATFMRDDDDATFLVVLQLWVEQKPVLVLRFGDEIHLLRFQKIPTSAYKDVTGGMRDQFRLLSNGPLIATDRAELGPSVSQILRVVRRSWDRVTHAGHWAPGNFRKQPVAILALPLDVSLPDFKLKTLFTETVRFLEDLREKPNDL